MNKELSFCELKRREVINCIDGKRLGRIIDIIFCAESGKIKGILLPYFKKGFFNKNQELYIPWSCIQKIGADIIIVEIIETPYGMMCQTHDHHRHDTERHEHRDNDKNECCREEHHRGECHEHRAESLKGGGVEHGGECDKKCEKCMLFDCANRWNFLNPDYY